MNKKRLFALLPGICSLASLAQEGAASPDDISGSITTDFLHYQKRKMDKLFSLVKTSFMAATHTPVVIFLMLICFNAGAQSQTNTDSLKTDSVYHANQTTVQPGATVPANKKQDNRPLSQRIDFDINTSFWINPSNTFFEFSPVVAYKLPKIISVGAGPAYIYNRDRIHRTSLNGWGGKVFSRAQLTRWFYGYTEYQGINNQYISQVDPNTHNITKSKDYVDSWFLSLGVNLRMGKRHGLNFQALYDLLYNKNNSPYFGAWTYRIGFGF